MLNGTVITPGVVGNAFKLNGQSVLEAPYVAGFVPTSEFTIELWVRLDAPHLNTYTRLAGVQLDNQTNSSWLIGVGYYGGLYFGAFLNGTNSYLDQGNPLPVGSWVHVAGTWDGILLRGYVNGVLQDTVAVALSPLTANPVPFRMGRGDTTGYGLNGAIDEVSFYRRTLSETELQAIVAAGPDGKCKTGVYSGSAGGGGGSAGGGTGGSMGGGTGGGGGPVDGGAFTVIDPAPFPRTNPTSVFFNGALHVFDYDPVNGDLMWCPDANAPGGCAWQTLDGSGGLYGRVSADVGAECIAAAVWNGILHVVYRQDDTNSGHVLRHALYGNGHWSIATIDGRDAYSHGRTAHRVGGCPSLVQQSLWLFLSFYDYDARTLRIGWHSNLVWDFAPMDGNGGSSGRITADVGYWSSMVATTSAVHLFYTDATNDDLRQASWNSSGLGAWQCSTLDGQGQGTNDPIRGRIASVIHQGAPHVFYQDASSGDLRHAWGGPPWSYEVVDGDALTGGRTTNVVGAGGISALSTSAALQVFYYDSTAGDLRRAWWPGTSWNFEVVDGNSLLNGRVDADVGRNPHAVTNGSSVDVFYEGPSTTLRRATW